MSVRLTLLNAGLRSFVKPALRRLKTPQEARRHMERGTGLMAPLLPRMRIVQEQIDGPAGPVPVEWVSAEKADRRAIILYLHGGAFIMGSPRTHRPITTLLARESGFRVMVPDYRLAPEHPCPAAVEDALAAYTALLARGYAPERIALAGESAGGGLALAMLGLAEAKGFPMPGCVVAFSPWTDLTMSGDSYTGNATADAMLPLERAVETVGYYLGEMDPRDPLASPLFMTLRAPPPVFLSAGGTEMLRDDTLRMAEALRAMGGEVTVEMAGNAPHAWPFFARLVPESAATLNRAVAFVRKAFEGNAAA